MATNHIGAGPEGHSPTILVVDDDKLVAGYIAACLEQTGCPVHKYGSVRGLPELIANLRPALLFLDNILGDGLGLDALPSIQRVDPDLPIILMTGAYSAAGAVEAIRCGASDYMGKPFDEANVVARARHWLAERKRQRVEAEALRLEESTFQMNGMVGKSLPMQQLFGRLRRIAPHFETLLIHGETGVGKDCIANAAHQLGLGPTAPFVPVNCAGLSETLFESELFGYVRGAFTGATQDRTGLIASANHGTLFLDEIGELPLHLQAKLLRTLQAKEVRPVGANRAIQVDVRVIAATNQDLRAMVSAGKFREDLFYRLNTITLRVPPLRERPDDLPVLISYFLNKFSQKFGKPVPKLTLLAHKLLMQFPWPGNVRELESAIAYCCMTVTKPWIDLQDLPEWLVAQVPSVESEPVDASHFPPLRDVIEQHFHRALQVSNGNRKEAARLLGVSRTTLHRMLGRELHGADDTGQHDLDSDPLVGDVSAGV